MKIAVVIILIVFSVLFWLGSRMFVAPSLDDAALAPLREAVSQIEQQILAPPPLRAAREAARSHLTIEGTVTETNRQRANNGLPPLASNADLAAAAAAKVDDMFAYQYFAHESPTGKNAGDLAQDAGYAYILVGENLALGNFENDAVLVQAWMDSPGHRANILHERFEEIGVSVKRGVFEGKTTWLAVQEFGTPRSACPQPDPALKAKIDYNTDQLDAHKALLDRERSVARQKQDREAIEAYNQLVDAYNRLVAETKALVDAYNAEVRQTNACIQSR